MTDTEFLQELRNAVGDGNVRTDAHDMAPFLEDWRGYRSGRALAVVLPATTEQVAAVMTVAARAGRAVVPQGGNTGLCQGAVPSDDGGGIVLATRRMAQVRELDKPAGVIVAEAGTTLAALQDAAAQAGRRVPISLGSEGTAQVGGLVSTNAGGTSALRHGPMREMVCGIEVVLPDGRIFSDLGALRKNNTGYDLKNLFIGAEGTLGIVTAVALRMQPQLRTHTHAWLALADLEAAVAVLTGLQDDFDATLQAAELLSGNQVDLVLRHIPRTRHPLDSRPDWSLLIELGSTDPDADLQSRLEGWLADRFESGLLTDAVVAQNAAQGEAIWHLRHSVSEANKIEGHSLSHDVAVRPSLVPQMIHRCSRALSDIHPQAQVLIVSHIGDGNVHFIAHFSHGQWADIGDPETATAAVMSAVHDQVVALGGTFSAEHGIGRKLRTELAQRGDPVRLDLMRRVRAMLDPDGRMNPGAVL